MKKTLLFAATIALFSACCGEKCEKSQVNSVDEAKAKIAALEADKAPAEETISDGATTDDVDSTDPAPAEETKKTSSSKKGKK